jgi:hypothetical protein
MTCGTIKKLSNGILIVFWKKNKKTTNIYFACKGETTKDVVFIWSYMFGNIHPVLL